MAGWTGFPATLGADLQSYVFASQIPRAIRERYWAAGTKSWPQGNFEWSSGTITSATDNGDGSYTLNHASDGTAASRWYNFTGHAPTPANYDLIVDDLYDETIVIHLKIYGSTSTTLKVDSSSDHILVDLATGAFLYPNLTTADILTSLAGRTYHIIQRGGEWWAERWLQWPNDQEQWVGTALVAGALQPVTLLTSSGTTATATVTGHQFLTGDSVTIAGATSTNSRFNGTFSVTVVDADTFTYTLAGTDDPTAGGTITASEPHVGAHDTSASYPDGDWATGFSLMVNGSDGLLKRITLTDNSTTNLLFTRNSYTVSGQYAVMAANNTLGHPSKYRFYNAIDALCGTNDMHSLANPFSGPVFAWYNSRFDNYWTRLPTNPTDTLGATKLPASSVTLLDSSGLSYSQACFDIDVWTDSTDTHNPPDKNYTPDMWRTIRGWQIALENLATNTPESSKFVKAQSYDGAKAIPAFVCATMFEAAGVNAVRGNTTTLTGSSINTNVSTSFFAYYPHNVYWAVVDNTEAVVSAGTGSVANVAGTVVLSKDTGSFAAGETSQQVVISKGWTRNYPNEFMYMRDKKCWIPSPDAVTGNPVTPPTSTYPGTWYNRPKSTKYKEAGASGFVADANGFRTFVDGQFARYSGDNWNDPTAVDPRNGDAVLTSDTHGFHSYYDNFYEGTKDDAAQAAIVASMSGTVTRAESMYIEDNSKNWWPGGYYDAGSVSALGGTGNGSSSTTELNDTTKAGSNIWNTISSGVGGMLDNIIKVTISGTDYYRRISAHPANGPDVFWAEALPASALGNAYLVRWPKFEMNLWKGLTLHMTYPDGSTHDVTITANDDQRIFFTDLGTAPPVGTTYRIQFTNQIQLPAPGGVWQWQASTSSWIIPTGNDPRTGVAWKSDQSANLPTRYTNYGRYMKGDYVALVFDQLQAVCNALIHTKATAAWSGQGHNNYKFGQDNGNVVFSNGSTGAQDRAKSNYAAFVGGSNNAPFACSYTKSKCNGGGSIACYDYAVGRRYCYGTASISVVNQSSQNDWYVQAEIAADPSTGGWPGQSPSASCPTIAVWDDMGDGVLLDEWHLYSSDIASNSTSRVSGTACGDTGLSTPTDIGPAAPLCPTDCAWYQGWVGNPNGITVFKYNNGSGFHYY